MYRIIISRYGTRNVKSHDVSIENLFWLSEVLNVYDYTMKCKMFDHFKDGGRFKKTSHKRKRFPEDFLVSQNQILTIQADLFSERICAHLAQQQMYVLNTPTLWHLQDQCFRW